MTRQRSIFNALDAMELATEGPWERLLDSRPLEHLSDNALVALAEAFRIRITLLDHPNPGASREEIDTLLADYQNGGPIGPVVRAIEHYNIHRADPAELKL